MPIVNQIIAETIAIKGEILPVSAATGTLYSNFAPAGSISGLQAKLKIGSIVGTADIQVQQAAPNLNAVGQTTTASAIATATTLAVSGGTYALNDWVSADGVNFVRVTSAYAGPGAGNLSVTALPAAVASGAAIVALGNSSTIASLSGGLASGNYPFADGQVPAVASAAGVYTLDVRASDLNQNNPTAQTDGTANGYNPYSYVRIAVVTASGSSSTLLEAELLAATERVPAQSFNAPGVVINQIKA